MLPTACTPMPQETTSTAPAAESSSARRASLMPARALLQRNSISATPADLTPCAPSSAASSSPLPRPPDLNPSGQPPQQTMKTPFWPSSILAIFLTGFILVTIMP